MISVGSSLGSASLQTTASILSASGGGSSGGSSSLYGDDLALEVSAVPTNGMRFNLIHDSSITPDFEIDWGNGEVHTYADAVTTNSTTAIFQNTAPISANAIVRIKSASKVCQRFYFQYSQYGQYVTACKQLGDIGYNSLQTMFRYTYNIVSFEAGTTDTSNVTSVRGMFQQLDNLVTCDLTGMVFSSVTDAYQMFYDCDGLTTLTGLANADFSQCANFADFMRGSRDIETIDISGANFGGSVSSCNFYQMFKDLRKLTSFDMSGTTFGPGQMSGFLYYAGYDATTGTTFNFTNSNVSQATNMYQFMYNARYATGSIDLTSWNTSNVTNLAYAFENVGSRWYGASGSTYDQANSPTFSGLNTLQTGSATDMQRMLLGTHDLNKNWDFSGWDISSCTNFYLAFYGTLVETLNLSNWTFATGASLRQMFGGNPALNNLNISGWNTTGVTSMRALFAGMGYTPITSYWATQGGLDVSHFDTSNVTDFSEMFNGLDVADLNITGFDTSSATTMYRMFYLCNNLNSLDVSGFNTSSVTNFQQMFYDCDNLTTLDVSGFNTSSATNMREMFHDCENLTSLDVSGFNTANVTSFYRMFRDCHDITTLDVSNFNTSSVTGIGFREMFHSCKSVTTLNVSGFNTSGATSLQGMFAYTESLTSLNVSSFNTTNVTNMQDTFRQMDSLTGTLDLTSLDTSSVTNMTSMFNNTGPNSSGTLTIDVTGWDVSSVTNMSNMFYYGDMTAISGLSGWNTSSLTHVGQMFIGANRITTPVDIDAWDITNVTSVFNFATISTILDTTEYDQLLVAWEADVSAVVGYSNGGTWNFGNVQYTTGSAADTARSNLINNHGWTIQDGGGT